MNLYRICPTNKDDLYPEGCVACSNMIVYAKDKLHAERLARHYEHDTVYGWGKIPLTVEKMEFTDKEFIVSSTYVNCD